MHNAAAWWEGRMVRESGRVRDRVLVCCWCIVRVR